MQISRENRGRIKHVIEMLSEAAIALELAELVIRDTAALEKSAGNEADARKLNSQGDCAATRKRETRHLQSTLAEAIEQPFSPACTCGHSALCKAPH